MKELYIVRHGIAVDVGEAGVRRDEDRMLSAEGRRRTAEAARGMKAVGCRPTRIYTSPLVRARETAEICGDILGGPVPVRPIDCLVAGGGARETLSWLRKLRARSVMIVGHEPDLSVLASVLISGCDEGCPMLFKKAALCLITFEKGVGIGQGKLNWLLPPAILRMIPGR